MKGVALLCLLLIFSGIIIAQSQPAEATSCSLAERCTVWIPLNCKNYATTNESIKLLLVNGAGRNMTIRNITAQSKAFSPVNGTDSNHNCSLTVSERDKLLEPDEGRAYTLDVSTEPESKCSYQDTGRNKNRYSLAIYYFWAGSPSITHRIEGDLYKEKKQPKRFQFRPVISSFFRLCAILIPRAFADIACGGSCIRAFADIACGGSCMFRKEKDRTRTSSNGPFCNKSLPCSTCIFRHF